MTDHKTGTRDEWLAARADLLELARRCDPEAICVFTAAVALARVERQGLGEWIDWLCRNDRRRAPIPVPEVSPGRSMAAFRA